MFYRQMAGNPNLGLAFCFGQFDCDSTNRKITQLNQAEISAINATLLTQRIFPVGKFTDMDDVAGRSQVRSRKGVLGGLGFNAKAALQNAPAFGKAPLSVKR